MSSQAQYQDFGTIPCSRACEQPFLTLTSQAECQPSFLDICTLNHFRDDDL
jgi:hypothetical protein